MRKIVLVTLLAAAFWLIGLELGAEPKPIVAPLDSRWHSTDAVVPPLGNVVYDISKNGKKKNYLSYILDGAQPNTDYNVGFNIQSATPDNTCSDLPLTFGGVPRASVPCFTEQGGCTGEYSSEGLYQVGTLSTDANGDGDLKINLVDIEPGTYQVVFWVSPGVGTLGPEASTACRSEVWNYETITIKE